MVEAVMSKAAKKMCDFCGERPARRYGEIKGTVTVVACCRDPKCVERFVQQVRDGRGYAGGF